MLPNYGGTAAHGRGNNYPLARTTMRPGGGREPQAWFVSGLANPNPNSNPNSNQAQHSGIGPNPNPTLNPDPNPDPDPTGLPAIRAGVLGGAAERDHLCAG